MASPSTRRIVVGVDGSPTSREALRWAARQAELTGAELHAVIAWHVPMTYGRLPPIVDDDLTSKHAAAALQQAVSEALDPARAGRVVSHVTAGRAAPVLLDAADGADLLVVGNRGHGAFAGMLLGSVAQHVAAHARCPVVVVRPPAAD